MVREATDGHGADVILDNMGAAYLGRNVVGAGPRGPARRDRDAGRDQGRARPRRPDAQAGSRSSPPRCARDRSAEKATICRAVTEHVWPLVADGTIRAIVDTTMPLAEAAEAHRRMESGGHTGKIVLVA